MFYYIILAVIFFDILSVLIAWFVFSKPSKPNLNLNDDDLDLICRALSDSMNFKPKFRYSDKFALIYYIRSYLHSKKD